jgi:hypothetical protein
MASDIARIGYVTRRQDIHSSLHRRHQYTLVPPWEFPDAPFQAADGTIGTSTSRPSIRELPQAEFCYWEELDSPEWPKTKDESSNSCWPALPPRILLWGTSVLPCSQAHSHLPIAHPTAGGQTTSSVSSSLPCSAIHVAGDCRRYCRVFANYRVGIG